MNNDQKIVRIFHNTPGTSVRSSMETATSVAFIDAACANGFSLADGANYLRDVDLRRRELGDKSRETPSHIAYYDPVRRALLEIAKRTHGMDAALDYALSDNHILNHKFLDEAYYSAPRSLLRKIDGSLRSAKDLGLLKSGKKALETLVKCAIRHRDPECIEHLHSFPAAQGVVTDQYIENVIRRHQNHNDYDEILECFADYMPKTAVEDMSLQAYWVMLEENECFSPKSPKSFLDGLYQSDLVIKCPNAFVFKILELNKWHTEPANRFIQLMQRDGMDCYDGYILYVEGGLAAYDKRDVRDYQTMIDVCLKRRHLSGYLGLLCGVPMEEIERHPRKAEVLNLIHGETGSHDAIRRMDRKQRGRALTVDLAL